MVCEWRHNQQPNERKVSVFAHAHSSTPSVMPFFSDHGVRGQLKCDGTRAETRFRLSAKRTSPFKSEGASVQSTTGSRGVRISGSNPGYTMFRGSVKGTGTHSIRQFPYTMFRGSVKGTGTPSISQFFYTMFRGSVKSTGTHSIRQFPLHFPSCASPCAITFQLDPNFKCAITDWLPIFIHIHYFLPLHV